MILSSTRSSCLAARQAGAGFVRLFCLGSLFFVAGAAHAQAPTVTSLSPARNARSAPRTTDVSVGFSQALSNNAATLGALKVFSQQSGGKKAGTATVSGNTLSFNPTTDFKAGETVFATVTAGAQSTSGTAATPNVFQFTTAVSHSSGTFASRQELPVGIRPSGIATGDIDGDGDLDLLATSSEFVSVRLNDGTGSFSGKQTLPIAPTYGIALGDLDADGDLDLVLGNYASSTSLKVNVLFNDGTGNFAGNQEVAVRGALNLALNDIDGDGDLDLLAAGGATASVRVNDGLGTFSGSQEVAVNGSTYDLAVADIDSDGDLDLLTTSPQNNTVSIRLNNGLGTFSGTYYVTVSGGPVGIVTADVDSDGDLDLITANGNGLSPNSNTNASVQLNNGSGTFSPALNLGVNNYAYDITAADVEGDGDLDLFIAYSTGVSVRLNNGAGTFSNGQEVTTGVNPNRIVAVDLDGDSDLDLLTLNGISSNDVSVRLNQNAVPSTPVRVSAVLPARNARSAPRNTDVAVSFNYALSNTAATQSALQVFSAQRGGKQAGTATVNGNTLAFNPNTDFKAGETVFATVKYDVVTTSNFALLTPHVFQFTTATSPSAGRFGAGSEVPVSNPNSNPASVATGDVDGDGDLDLLTANQGANSVSVRLNNGSGSFSGNQEVAVSSAPLNLALGDLDGDGDLDFATTNGLNTTSNGTISIRLNKGDGTFFNGPELTTDGRFTGDPNGLSLNDMDGDGDLDLVTTYPIDTTTGGAATSIRLNNGDGTFSNGAQVTIVEPSPKDVAVGDVDNDGDLDLLTTGYSNNFVALRLNNGLGTFSTQLVVTVGTKPIKLALGDLDGNGTLDLVTANSNSLSIRLNTNGIFGGTLNLALASAPLGVSLGDVDGDADLDLVVVRKDANGAEVYLNNGAASFTASQTIAVGSAPAALTLGDVDGDGALDLLTANSANQTVSVRLNKIILANAPAQLTEQVSLYPNPAHTSVRLRLPAELAKQRVQVRVLNALGQVVLIQTLAAQATPELALPHLAAGLYNLQLQTSQGMIIKRLAVE
ncbi:FG-GAP-like repeat-containing protein [Hymenobacter sp. GOD-10R]|uniref:FG-GAP-like repeat-containing protein n=1 Tax=Hymenobacter sp. GOD-10R TaxID=3093922 RepID=UPI002D7685C9|nr:FG-GAP-like repeat-containing protein [Hymenobacter sp. GOD-10R]WRQ28437.1 FG-GAP-like repeat-containing protein [Hymenobacter sp. GOD-10R]